MSCTPLHSTKGTTSSPTPNSSSVPFCHPTIFAPASFSTFFSLSITNLNPSSINVGLAFLISTTTTPSLSICSYCQPQLRQSWRDGEGVGVVAIAVRAAKLETELARLQHDSISDMSTIEEMMTEAVELRKLLPEMESKVELLDREVEFLKMDKFLSKEKIRDLEKIIGALEKKELGYGGEELKKSKEGEKSLELFVARLKEEARVAENVIRELNQKVDTVNGGVNKNGVIARDKKRVKDLNIQWPVVVAGSTIVATTAVICVFYEKHRKYYLWTKGRFYNVL
ncbi:hypothetical protein Ahy_A02g005129 isoform A [Arachis hypogaea]|uniref:Uncharacterized protein n=1 Tax=Arachis hypogaea TaxID=3818 RepID=A0A445E692_ARAHY|nr:hypothetical protein Ahy_A02g005129 isoform A [Arachis hypogaea]